MKSEIILKITIEHTEEVKKRDICNIRDTLISEVSGILNNLDDNCESDTIDFCDEVEDFDYTSEVHYNDEPRVGKIFRSSEVD